MSLKLQGVIPALVTPRDDARDEVDLPRLKALCGWLRDCGVQGLFPTSSTGEAPLLTPAQRRAVIETTVESVQGQIPVLAGVGAASTAESIRLARDAEAVGAACVIALPLHFVRVSPEELYGYFAAVADSVSIPTLLYNYPARTSGQNIGADVAARLASAYNVIGIKDSGGDLANSLRYLAACPHGFAFFVGSEALIAPALMMGAAGTICAAANAYPRQIVALYHAWQAGDFDTARRIQEALLPLHEIFSIGTFPASVKATMGFHGQPVGGPFLPALPLTPTQRQMLGERIAELKL